MRRVALATALAALTAASAASQPLPACFAFRDVTRESGLDFRHRSGRSPTRHLPETMGAGVAWLDADGDGWLDVYLVQSGGFPPGGGADAADQLFRNRGDGTFEDVSERAGIAADRGYGQGAVAADVDGDGDTDLFVANVGRDTLWINRGDGTFVDGTIAAGLTGDGWSSSAAFADADGDGDLDLYVARYVDYDPATPQFCGDFDSGRREYCDPSLFRGIADRFYLNRGDGTFADSTVEAGLADTSRGLGVVFTDLDGDRLPDVYVANDLDPNLLFHNAGGRFEDASLPSGAAVSTDGRVLAGMGIGVGDVDGDGLPELSVTNFDLEVNSLYRNLGDLLFEDVSAASGFGPPSYTLVGFGIALADFDRDGDLDAFITNGHVYEHPRWDTITYQQPPLLLAGDGAGHFRRCEPPAGAPRLGRGLAAADYDGDGDLDLAITDNDGAAQLLRNDGTGRWLGVRLLGRAPNSGALGGEVALGGQHRWLLAGDSYQSSSDPRVLFGVSSGRADDLTVTWRTGRRQRFARPSLGHYLLIGEPAAQP